MEDELEELYAGSNPILCSKHCGYDQGDPPAFQAAQ